MKLTLKRFAGGATSVRAGRLLKVAQPHAVPMSGRDSRNDDSKDLRHPDRPNPERPDEKWVYCQSGDLALEIMYRKSDNVLGHAYLSGPAIAAHRYTPHGSTWFEEKPLTMELLRLPEPTDAANETEFMKSMIETLMRAKYDGGADLYAFQVSTSSEDDTENAARMITTCFEHVPSSVPENEPGPAFHPHFVGLVRSRQTTINVHFQPPRHASKFACSPFQTAMLLDALGSKVELF